MLLASATSSTTGATGPASLSFCAAAFALAASRAVSSTRYPCCASWRQTSSPIPRLPPVTRAMRWVVFDFLFPVLLIAYMLHPLHHLVVETFLDRDVCHGGAGSRAMPMFLARRGPNHITGTNLFNRSALALRPSAPRSHDQRLAERMRMPSGTRTGLEGDAGSRNA